MILLALESYPPSEKDHWRRTCLLITSSSHIFSKLSVSSTELALSVVILLAHSILSHVVLSLASFFAGSRLMAMISRKFGHPEFR